MITERNYLEVYPYEKWSDKEIPVFEQGQEFTPKSIQLKQGRTEPAKLLTEADLIALMEKHGIGTDATHAEHIETIKERNYVSLDNQSHFIPAQLGLGLVEGYDSMGYQMGKPHLRAALELDLKAFVKFYYPKPNECFFFLKFFLLIHISFLLFLEFVKAEKLKKVSYYQY